MQISSSLCFSQKDKKEPKALQVIQVQVTQDLMDHKASEVRHCSSQHNHSWSLRICNNMVHVSFELLVEL